VAALGRGLSQRVFFMEIVVHMAPHLLSATDAGPKLFTDKYRSMLRIALGHKVRSPNKKMPNKLKVL
jgi:hypothetical protein